MPLLFLVELFAGTHSVSNAVRRSSVRRAFDDFRLLSVDVDPKFKPTVCADINSWEFEADIRHFLLELKPSDVVVVFPPCTEFSRALTSRPRDLKAGSRNVKSALKVTAFVRQLAGKCAWFLESPVGLLHQQRFMAPMEPHKNVCTYCRYGKAFKKPTHVWSNVPDLELKACSRDAPCMHLWAGRCWALRDASDLPEGL